MKSKRLDIVLKVIFIFSLIPYLYFLYAVSVGKYIHDGVEVKGIARVIEMFNSYIWYFNMRIPLFPVTFTYQMCYLFRNKPKIMFACSFIPIVILIIYSIHTSIEGVGFMTSTIAGSDAFILTMMYGLFLYVVVPILPGCLVFQIVFLIVRAKKKRRELAESELYVSCSES